MMANIISWGMERLAEPSSYAAIGVAITGVGVILDQPILVGIGVVGGILGFILKEKGII